MESPDSLFEVVSRILVAVACGALLGWERERRDRPAGLRTHMLVALGGASLTVLSLQLAFQDGARNEAVDPLRTVQGVVGGIGFLGAGSIIQARGAVHGLTTAATIWVVGAIGVACGAGAYDVALTTVVTAFLTLAVVGRLEFLVGRKRFQRNEEDQPSENGIEDRGETKRNADRTLSSDGTGRGQGSVGQGE